MMPLRPSADVRPVTEFRARTSAVLAQVHETKRPVVLTHNGRSTAVLLDVEVYEALMDELEERFRRLGALKAKTQILVDNVASRAFFTRRGYRREDDCEPWGKELVEGGAPPCR